MDGLTAAFHQRLANDAALVADINDYPAGSGTPAVFTNDRVPDDAKPPYISTAGVLSDEPWDTKDVLGRFINRDVYLFFPHRQTAAIERATERVRTLFHRHRLHVDGWSTVVARTSVRPVGAHDYDARIVTVSLRLMQSEEESS